MKDMIRHKGYFGSVHYNAEDRVFYGKIEFIRSLVSYEGRDADSLEAAFREAVEEYLVSSFEDAAELGDPRIITNALGVVARAKGMTQMARDADLSRTALYRALSEEGRPELSTIFKVMQALGLRLAPVRVDSAA